MSAVPENQKVPTLKEVKGMIGEYASAHGMGMEPKRKLYSALEALYGKIASLEGELAKRSV